MCKFLHGTGIESSQGNVRSTDRAYEHRTGVEWAEVSGRSCVSGKENNMSDGKVSKAW